MLASKSERKVRYSIRKFSIGVASVVVASLFLGGVVHAEGAVPANHPSPQKVSSGDKEYEDAVQKVNKEISDYMTSRLDTLNRSASGFSEILQKVRGVVEDYRKQIDEALSKDGVEKLGEEAKKKIDELVEAFQNNSDNQIPPKDPSQNDGVQGDAPSAGQGKQPGVSNPGDSKPVPPETSGETKPGDTPSDSSTDKPSGTPQAGNQSDKPAPSLSDTKEVQDLIKKGFQELEKLEKSLQELDEKAELPDEEFYGKQKTIWDNQKSTIRKSIKDFKDIVKDIASKYHKENYFKKYNSDFKDYQLYVQMEIMTRQVRDYLLRYPKDGDIIKEFESGMKQTASDNYSNLSGDNLKGYFEKNFRSAFEKIQETVRKLEKKAPAPKTPEKPQKSEQPKPSKPQVKSPVQKVFTTQNGNAKITVMFETATEADSVNLKEVTTKEMIDNVTRQTGQGTVRIFDISLSKDGKETHVNGERVVRLAIGNIDSEIQVYHVKENGELELLPSTVENGQVVFKTSHFSLFAIKTLPKKQMVVEPEANREGKIQSDDKEMVLLADKANQMSENRSNSDKKDKQALPSTGTMSTLLMEFLGLISLAGVYLLKGKKTEND